MFACSLVVLPQATVLSKHAQMAHASDPFFRLIGQHGDLVRSPCPPPRTAVVSVTVALRHPELKASTPAHTKHLCWYLEFESRVTHSTRQTT